MAQACEGCSQLTQVTTHAGNPASDPKDECRVKTHASIGNVGTVELVMNAHGLL